MTSAAHGRTGGAERVGMTRDYVVLDATQRSRTPGIWRHMGYGLLAALIGMSVSNVFFWASGWNPKGPVDFATNLMWVALGYWMGWRRCDLERSK